MLPTEAMQTGKRDSNIPASTRGTRKASLDVSRLRQRMVEENQNRSSQKSNENPMATRPRTEKLGSTKYCVKPIVETAGCDEHVRWCERGRLATVPYSIECNGARNVSQPHT